LWTLFRPFHVAEGKRFLLDPYGDGKKGGGGRSLEREGMWRVPVLAAEEGEKKRVEKLPVIRSLVKVKGRQPA